MLTPTTLTPIFNPLGGTPAVQLTRCMPLVDDSESADARADILVLGSRDLRHILHTCYTERVSQPGSAAPRKLDITCCDDDDAIVARNVLFLTLLVAEEPAAPGSILWNLYYHLYLDDESVQVLKRHVEELQRMSTSLIKWEEGRFSDKIRFGDANTLVSVHNIWSAYLDILSTKEDAHEYQVQFAKSLDKTREFLKDGSDYGEALRYRGARAASPLGFQSLGDSDLTAALESWLETGTLGSPCEDNKIPNPLFAVPMVGHPSQQRANRLLPTTILSPVCNPLLSFHLAVAEAQLTGASPMRSVNSDDQAQTPGSRLVSAARLQFSEWTKALRELSSQHLVVRFISADCLAFCHSLQHRVQTGKACSNLYRRQFSPSPLELDMREYALREAPAQFDVIEAGDLSDFLGLLNVLVSAGPLLKDKAWATLHTETAADYAGIQVDKMLGGPFGTMTTLLGISPVEYWTNATAVSHVDQYMLAASAAQTAPSVSSVRYRLSWKENRHASGQPPWSRLTLDAHSLADIILLVYENMLNQHTSFQTNQHGSLAAFIKRLLQCVDTDRQAVCQRVLQSIIQPQLSLALSMQGLYNPVRSEDEQVGKNMLSTWPSIPEAVYITTLVPADQWKPLEQTASLEEVPFSVQGCISIQDSTQELRQSTFDDTQISFGKTEASISEGGDSELMVTIWPDAGADMIVSFCVPAAAVQHDPTRTKVSLRVQNNHGSREIFGFPADTGDVVEICSAGLNNTDLVYITTKPPRQPDHPVYNSLEPNPRSPSDTQEGEPHFFCELDSSGRIVFVTGHLPITSTKGKELLAEKVAVQTRKTSLCTFQVALGGRDHSYELKFPVPVVKEGSKTRIARTSGYIEVMAPSLAEPATSQELDGFIFPAALAELSGVSLPLPLSLPRVILDTLPILDLSSRDRLSFLPTLTSLMFSARERKLREEAESSGTTSLAPSARMNLKESLFAMFMFASGLQGGQTGLFSLNHQESGNHILIFVSAIRLDPANASVVLDAAVMPITEDLLRSGILDTFLLILRSLECCCLMVDDADLVLWKKALPALVERCRTWHHRRSAGCEYRQPGAGIPLSTDPGRQVVCSCGAGKLPDNFINLPEWDAASQFATRIAISPFYASALVEEVVDPTVLRSTVAAAAANGGPGGEVPRCRNCGATEEEKVGVALKKCTRCLKVRYCSVECQRRDWKKHRMECEEEGGEED